jgi:HSP20 family protein
MTLITRYEPFREFAAIQNRMSRLFRDSFGNDSREEALANTAFAPPVDVYEDEHNVTLKIEVPGIDEKDIDVHIENNTLTVHGERKFEKEEKEENYRRASSVSMAASHAPSPSPTPSTRKTSRPTMTRAC